MKYLKTFEVFSDPVTPMEKEQIQKQVTQATILTSHEEKQLNQKFGAFKPSKRPKKQEETQENQDSKSAESHSS